MIRTGWRIYGFTGRSRGERVPVRRDRRQRGRGSRRHRRSAVAPGAGASRAGPGPEARLRQMSHDENNGIQLRQAKGIFILLSHRRQGDMNGYLSVHTSLVKEEINKRGSREGIFHHVRIHP